MDKPVFALRLKQLREQAGMSQMELAIRAGLSASSVAQLEQGKKPNPTLATLEALARGLGVGLEQLVTLPEPRKSRRRGGK